MEGRSTERVAVFVDGANLYHSIKNYYKGILDYARLLSAAAGDMKLLRATFYIVEKQEADEGQGTLQAAHGARDTDPRRGEDRLAQGRLGYRRRGGHDAPRRARRYLRPRLWRRRLRGGRRVPPERKRHPRRGHKRRPVHLPGPSRRLRRPHRPGRHTGSV